MTRTRKRAPNATGKEKVPMTRKEFAKLVADLGDNHPGENRVEWQRLAGLQGKLIPSEWLTKHITHMGTLTRGKDRAKQFQARRDMQPAASRKKTVATSARI